MEAINIKAYTEDTSQIEAIKAFMKALKIKFEVSTEKPYNPDFVAKIQKNRQDYKEGKFTRVKIGDLDTFMGVE